jgi:hypothetical protein
MWLLTSFLPDWFVTYFVHLIFVLGLVATFASSIMQRLPFISNYGNLIKPIGMIILALGLFLEGSWWNQRGWNEKIADLEQKIVVAETKSKETNIQIQKEVIEKIKIVKEKVYENNQAIEAKRSAINAECKLSDDAWVLYNRATQNGVASGSK